MDFIFELIAQIILEGTIEVCTTKSKKVPLVLRLLAGLILGVVYGGLFIGLFYVGIANNSSIAIGISFFLFVVAIIFLVKSYRAGKRKKNDAQV